MKLSQLKIDRARMQEIASQAGGLIFIRPSIVFFVCAGLSLIFLIFVWWQYVIQLDFSREEGRRGIFLNEERLRGAVESIEQRSERFDNALKQEYKDLFQ